MAASSTVTVESLLFALPVPTTEELAGNAAVESVGDPEELYFCSAGRGFVSFLRGELRLLNLSTQDASPTSPSEADPEDEKIAAAAAAKRKVMDNSVKTDDPYELLGLGHLRWMATETQLKDGYRTSCLQAHPDKCGGDDTRFKAIQAAWEQLNTLQKRRAFDSLDNRFDDTLPEASGELSPEVFFANYSLAFQKNGHWSEIQPVPVSLGDMQTPWAQVEKFYAWWRVNFRSWRDFSTQDDYDIKDADSRDERRWMERQNAKKQQQKRKAETERIARLIENAYRADPRVAEKNRAITQQRAEARRAQQELVRKRRQAEQQFRAAKELEEAAKQEEELRQRMEKETAARLHAAALEDKREEFRQLCGKVTNRERLEATVLRLSIEQLTSLAEEMKAAGDGGVGVIGRLWAEWDARDKAENERKRAQEAAVQAKDKDAWTADELANLANLLKKYPGGYPNRWDKVAEFLTTKTKRQIIAKTKTLQEDRPDEVVKASNEEGQRAAWERFQATKKVAKRDITAGLSYSKDAYDVHLEQEATARKGPWSFQEQEQLELGVREVPPESENRWDLIAKFVPTRSVAQVKQRYRLCWLIVNKPKQAAAIIEQRKRQWEQESGASSSVE